MGRVKGMLLWCSSFQVRLDFLGSPPRIRLLDMVTTSNPTLEDIESVWGQILSFIEAKFDSWVHLAVRATRLARLRRKWSLVGSWLKCIDNFSHKSMRPSATRRWWGVTGQYLNGIKKNVIMEARVERRAGTVLQAPSDASHLLSWNSTRVSNWRLASSASLNIMLAPDIEPDWNLVD